MVSAVPFNVGEVLPLSHDGTAEPFRVSPPEAAAYQCELSYYKLGGNAWNTLRAISVRRIRTKIVSGTLLLESGP
jgi:hypothetical protein